MSQRAVEAVLGRLITDVQFRVRFFTSPAQLCRDNEVALTARETAALLRVDLGALQQLGLTLDPKIVRAAVVEDPRGAHAARLPARGAAGPSVRSR